MAGLLAGRKALVTGAGAGIGRAIALALAREGARVVVTDLDGEAADQVAAEIGPETLSFALDVTRAAEVEEVMNRARSRMRGLDILCANAGVSTMNPVRDLSEEEWDYNMAVNAKGVFLTNQAAIRLWEPVGHARRHRQHGLPRRRSRAHRCWPTTRPASSPYWASPRRWPGRWRRSASA